MRSIPVGRFNPVKYVGTQIKNSFPKSSKVSIVTTGKRGAFNAIESIAYARRYLLRDNRDVFVNISCEDMHHSLDVPNESKFQFDLTLTSEILPGMTTHYESINDMKNAESEALEPYIARISRRTHPQRLARVITSRLVKDAEDNRVVGLQYIGQESHFVTMSGLLLAKSFIARDNLDILFQPGFIYIKENGDGKGPVFIRSIQTRLYLANTQPKINIEDLKPEYLFELPEFITEVYSQQKYLSELAQQLPGTRDKNSDAKNDENKKNE